MAEFNQMDAQVKNIVLTLNIAMPVDVIFGATERQLMNMLDADFPKFRQCILDMIKDKKEEIEYCHFNPQTEQEFNN